MATNGIHILYIYVHNLITNCQIKHKLFDTELQMTGCSKYQTIIILVYVYYIDIPKRFNTIIHAILLKNMYFNGLKDYASKWLYPYNLFTIVNRLYRVKINYLESVNFR